MKKISKLGFKIVFVVALCFVCSNFSLADTQNNENVATGFYYEIEYPANQIGTGGALNLRVTPGEEEIINLKLESYSDEDLVIELSIDQAATNNVGGIQYGPNNIELDKSLKYKIDDYVSIENEVTLPARETVVVPLKVKAPKDNFDGIILGSLQMMKKGQEDDNKTDSPVTNVFAFLVGITLSSNDNSVTKELELNKISAGLSNYRNAFLINLSNISPVKLDNFSIDATLTKSDDDSISYKVKKLDMEMAPNSIIQFPVSLNGEKLVAGNYKAHIKATSGSSEWEWDEDFSVSNDEADKYNREDVSIVQERGLSWKTIIIIVVSILVLVLIIVVSIFLYKKKTHTKKRR